LELQLDGSLEIASDLKAAVNRTSLFGLLVFECVVVPPSFLQ
jgi:hypothetical protein